SITGFVMYYVQCVELEKRQVEELESRFQLIGPKAAHYGTQAQWERFGAVLTGMTPEDDSLRYFVDTPDPRFGFGKPFPRDAVTTPRAPDVWTVQ
ncbi:hypothetical protein ABTH30_20500, partial [Acinetobacter baumannii]